MITDIAAADNTVEYFGIAHGHTMTETAIQNQAENPSYDRSNGRENVLRDASGKLLPGGPGLPGCGRPKGSGVVSDAIKAALREGKAEEVRDKLFGLMDEADRDSVRLAAISEIMDRSEGKAVQNHRHAGIFMVLAPGEEVLSAAFGSVAPEEE